MPEAQAQSIGFTQFADTIDDTGEVQNLIQAISEYNGKGYYATVTYPYEVEGGMITPLVVTIRGINNNLCASITNTSTLPSPDGRPQVTFRKDMRIHVEQDKVEVNGTMLGISMFKEFGITQITEILQNQNVKMVEA